MCHILIQWWIIAHEKNSEARVIVLIGLYYHTPSGIRINLVAQVATGFPTRNLVKVINIYCHRSDLGMVNLFWPAVRVRSYFGLSITSPDCEGGHNGNQTIMCSWRLLGFLRYIIIIIWPWAQNYLDLVLITERILRYW